MPTHAKNSRIGVSRLVLRSLLGATALGALCTSGDANAQIAGTTVRPVPNVLLLVDNSGSMERMVDNSLPSQNRNPVTGAFDATNACAPGSPTNPNRWGMLIQALTGNLQPYYSCAAIDRTTAAFKNEFKINGNAVYDADYFLPYHRPLTGVTAATACTRAPYFLPGASPGAGIGPTGRGSAGAGPGLGNDARDLPPNAFAEVRSQHVTAITGFNSPIDPVANACTFEQANDGQLDAARDYVRFGLMTFDNDPSPAKGILGVATQTVDTVNPFVGQWSYTKSPLNSLLSSNGTALGFGRPGGCSTGATAFEVGARHDAAPPWEGRMVPFPPPTGDTYDIQTTNDAIQKVLLSTRPYGATPIEGMMEDARDYYLYNPTGPNGTTPDPYVTCRRNYIILMTDGAPNLDLRPNCEGVGPPTGQCPFNRAPAVALSLSSSAVPAQQVDTYVIGFAVNGSGDANYPNDGFPSAAIKTCKDWYSVAGGTSSLMRTACTAAAATARKGSTAAACCELNEIAYNGTNPVGAVGPFFAETQADLVLSFGRVLGGVARSATTRTLPGYAPPVTVAVDGSSRTASFVASFIPNTQKVWSGEIDRTRSYCAGATPTPQGQSVPEGDSYSANLAAQAIAGQRRFISYKEALNGGFIDSARTIRPYTTAPIDNIAPSLGNEVSAKDDGLKGTTNWAEAMDILPNIGGKSPTCKRSRGFVPGAFSSVSIDIPSLAQSDCKDMLWGFATAKAGAIKPGASIWDFNVRCAKATGNLATGFCSISGTIGCSVANPASCAIPGEVCVPDCTALGAIYRSSPVLVGTPNQFVRDPAYEKFADLRKNRRPTMYVATTDGVLHAFKSLATNNFDFDLRNFELWAFVPPAVLPKIASNYPTGQQILLDGTPAVRDTVWDRTLGTAPDVNIYHTTLVSGLGASGGGYYALNVSDPDCGGLAGLGCINTHVAAASKDAAHGTAAVPAVGPHFLWQLTDIPIGAADPAKKTRLARDGTQMVALFGSQSGTPVITTLQVDPDGNGARQIGVAILPGGIDGPPVKGGTCVRAMDSGGPYNPINFDSSAVGFPRRREVRQWGKSCAATDPVAGRSVTVVRLDTGEIIRHFGRVGQDVPTRIPAARTTDTPFDSPIIGTPAVYPNIVGATAQKAFVGDADGTLWRLDLSSANPANWKVTLFQDLINTGLTPSCGTVAQCAAASQPIMTPPVLSLDPSGGIVINAATGDQENIVVTTERNYVYSVQEARPTVAGTPGIAVVKWYSSLANGQRVSGPMTVFDRTLYYATYTPAIPTQANMCSDGGSAFLWGVDFFNAEGAGITNGGARRWCPLGSVLPSGVCNAGLTQGEDPVGFDSSLRGAIIPGVTIRAAQSCASFDATANDPSITGLTSTKFDIFFGATGSRSGAGTGTPQTLRPEISMTRPLPRTTASIDAWALVVD